MVEKIIELVSGIPLEWQVFILAMIPVTELRAAIPYGIAQGLSPYVAMIMAILGDVLIAVPLLFLLGPATKVLSKAPFVSQIINKVLTKTRKKGGQVAKFGLVGLLLFVAFPAPGTGIWTGSLLAHLFGFGFGPSIMALSGGVVISAVVVTLISVGMLDVLGFSFPWILGIILIFILFYYLGQYFLKRKKS